MLNIVKIVAQNLDILGVVLLFSTLVPIQKLMRELPQNGIVRKRWKILSGLIFLFIGSYLYIALKYRISEMVVGREMISILLFLGALFVFLVSALSLQTALDVKRIDTLERENITDPLMGINNRRHLERRLRDEFAKARRHDLPLSLLMIDIDHFKDVNDTFGHDAGDMVLKNLGALIAQSIRSTDCVARYGGEEIVVIYPNTCAKDALRLAERLRHIIEKSVIIPADNEVKELRITVSIGGSTNQEGIANVEDLLKLADNAMYKAKNAGRNRVFMSDGSTPST